MHNLNPRYTMIGYDIHQAKNYINHLTGEDLLDLCPRLIIPPGSLFYHTTKLAIDELYADQDYYPPKNGCHLCRHLKPLPRERVGSKPRIMELSSNPNKKVNKCTCQTGQQQRLYGNFNFLGNYTLSLGKTNLQTTEVFINIDPILLIDLNFISVELGFSPKTFLHNGKEVKGQFSMQSVWLNYCQKHHLDGLVMIDLIDAQEIDLNYKSVLSCYNYKKGVACPEFVMINPIGAASAPNIGTNKLRVLGAIQLFDQLPLTRVEVEIEFQLLFNRIQTLLLMFGIDIKIMYQPPITLFKTLVANATIKSVMKILKDYHHDLLITSSDYHQYKDVIYESDITALKEYEKYHLELYEPININLDISSPININLTVPKNNPSFYFKDGSLVQNYASEKLFDDMLTKVAHRLDLNASIYVPYTQLDYFKSLLSTLTIKEAMDKVEMEVIIQYYLKCFDALYHTNIDYLPQQLFLYLQNHPLLLKESILNPCDELIFEDILSYDDFMIRYLSHLTNTEPVLNLGKQTNINLFKLFIKDPSMIKKELNQLHQMEI